MINCPRLRRAFFEMKIHEYQAKTLFEKAGIPVPIGGMAVELKEAQEIVKEIGFPAVLKSQVLVGGRGLAGGIKVVKNNDELTQSFSALKNLTIKGCRVQKILVVKAVSIKKEIYMSITVDNAHNDAVLILSTVGGVDIEETARKNPAAIRKYYFHGKKALDEARWRDFVKTVFGDCASQEKVSSFAGALSKVFFQNDCTLAEINPVVIDDKGRWMAADSKVILDDNALFRHPGLKGLRDLEYEDPDEIEAKEHDLSFVKMDGNIGCIVNGAGLAMATTDVIKFLGGEPANFLDVGGSSNPEKVVNALKIILKNQKVKVILINIFGGITRCDDIAKGLLDAIGQLNFKTPLVVRLTGTNEKEAVELLTKNKMNIYSSMRKAVEKAVELSGKT